jgi:hypothetical protein
MECVEVVDQIRAVDLIEENQRHEIFRPGRKRSLQVQSPYRPPVNNLINERARRFVANRLGAGDNQAVGAPQIRLKCVRSVRSRSRNDTKS